MGNLKLRQFDKQLKNIAAPCLIDHGFIPFPHRIFRRNVEHEGTTTTQVVDYQIGIKGLIGRFTVNIGVYNCELMPDTFPRCVEHPTIPDCMSDLTQRLGFYHVPKHSLTSRLLGRPKPAAYDHWWLQSEHEKEMTQTMQTVTDTLIDQGLGWLTSRSTRKAFEWAAQELQRRKEWKQQLSQPNAVPTFHASPFPG